MDLIKVMEMFPTQEDCIAYLERLRWQGSPECPDCENTQMNVITDISDAGTATIADPLPRYQHL